MRLEITDQEQKLLIEGEQKQLIQELDHTDSRDYKTICKCTVAFRRKTTCQ